MAQGHDGFDMTEYERDLDSMMTSVMPDRWIGHGRLKIHERSFSTEKHNFAERLLGKLNEKYPDVSGERLAETAIEKTEEKLG